MKARIDYAGLSPEPIKAMYALSGHSGRCGLEHSLLELVKVRASQLNHCAFCLDMHTQDARVAGETEQRLYALSAWREAPFFSGRERAALAWTEAVTLLPGGVADDVFDEARAHFSEKELVDLNWAVVTINAWNRLAVPFRVEPGTYRPSMRAALEKQLVGE